MVYQLPSNQRFERNASEISPNGGNALGLHPLST